MAITRSTAQTKAWQWFRRYAPLEAAGTIGALVGAWLALALTEQMAAVVVAATIGENLGYYGLAALRELQRHNRLSALRSHSLSRSLAIGWRTLRGLLLEFGPAELLDSAWIRPGLMFMMSRWVESVAASVLLGKLLADLLFYAMAISGHELERRRQRAVLHQEVTSS
ncbi:MAG: hypothetical protein IPJ58_15890 [Ardenticatenia bacterium]|nr:hypothetical protein [Ardenticatenia bacterium]